MTPNTEQAALSVSVTVAQVHFGSFFFFLPLTPGDVIILSCPRGKLVCSPVPPLSSDTQRRDKRFNFFYPTDIFNNIYLYAMRSIVLGHSQYWWKRSFGNKSLPFCLNFPIRLKR